MKDGNTGKRMRERRAYRWLRLIVNILLYRCFLLLTSLLPHAWALRSARGFGRIKYRWLRQTLTRQASNMEQRLGGDPKQVEHWLKRSFEHETCENLDGCLFYLKPKDAIVKLIDLRGLENLASALQRGKGAILYSGHVRGHYTFFAALGLLGYRPNIIRLMVSAQLHPVRRWLYERRNALMERKLGCRFLWMQPGSLGVAVRAANALRRNEIVIMLVDLSFSEQNLEVRFLNDRARIPSGLVTLAEVTGAPLLDFFVHRTDEGRQIAEVGPLVYAADDPAATAQQCASRLEQKIIAHPAEWSPWLLPDGRPPYPTRR